MKWAPVFIGCILLLTAYYFTKHEHVYEEVDNPVNVKPIRFEYCLEDSSQVLPSGKHVTTIRSREYFK